MPDAPPAGTTLKRALPSVLLIAVASLAPLTRLVLPPLSAAVYH
jgi:hypothetical protein